MKIFRFVFTVVVLAPSIYSQPLPFQQAVELAVKRGTALSATERVRAYESFRAAQRTYIPQTIIGSGLAKSFGFPMSIEGSAPSVINMNASSFLINFAQRDLVRAARAEWNASNFSSEDRRQQTILDAAITYTQLDRLTAALSLLRQQEQEATKAEQMSNERVQAGVEPKVELTRAMLGTARVRMATTQVQGTLDLLRAQLSQLTGVPAQSIETVTESIPELPAVSQTEDLAAKAAAASLAVKLAFIGADAKQLRARAEHKQLYPAVDFVGQYGLFAKYNNYEDFFKAFQRHNGVIGVAIRFPFFNLAQRARAAAADAEAVQARSQAEGVRNKVSNDTLKLQRDAAQLAAAREVARLEYELARSDVDVVQTRVQAGTATLRDEANARLVESQRYSAYLDASFQLEQSQIQLLRSTGDLEKWALAQK